MRLVFVPSFQTLGMVVQVRLVFDQLTSTVSGIPIQTRVLRKISSLTGYFIFRKKFAPVGFDLFSDIRHRLQIPMRVVFDVGANVGQTTKEILEFYPDANIYSFEPIGSVFEQLAANTKAWSTVHANHCALGADNTTKVVRLYGAEDSVCNSLNESTMNPDAAAQLETIQISKGDTICTEKGIESIDFLKIDTEGYELEVIRGFSEMLKAGRIRAILCEVSFNREDFTHTYINDLNDLVGSFGYSFYALYDISNAAIKVGRNYANVLYVSPTTRQQLREF